MSSSNNAHSKNRHHHHHHSKPSDGNNNAPNVDNDSFTTTSSMAPGEYQERQDAAFAGFSDHINQKDHHQSNNLDYQTNNSFAAFRGEAPTLPKEVSATFVNLSRVTRSQDECKDNYNKQSKFYDFFASSSERKFTDVGLEQMDVKSGERMLDLGCGTGYGVSQMAKKVGSPSQNPNASVIGVDTSQGMLDQAKARLEKEKLLDRTTLLCCNALQLPFANNTFDGVLLSFVVELFDNDQIPTLLAEVLRVLKPNGRFTVVALVRKVEKVAVRMYEWFHKKFPTLVDCRPIYIRETLAALNSMVKVTKHAEATMWGLPVEIVTARKRDDEEVASIKRHMEDQELRNAKGVQNHNNFYRELVTDVSTEAAKMITMQKDGASSSSSSSATSSTLSSANDSFDDPQQQSRHQKRSAQNNNKNENSYAVGPRESVLGDTSAIVLSEFGEMKFKAVPRSQWMEDQQTENCYLCKKEFGFFTRKHHCRICGYVCCAKCCEQKVMLTYGSKEKERVCDSCFDSMGTTEKEM